ncbi:hypothetical protein KPSA3_05520 [Pseudomonas syringae pv. actinidiae]|uniref:Uncharacterized protein n=1 Tax=Pseudomonas syringae pv. actinidiae TaxID=103796 RepID=A0AAN4Q8I3_PSESF|nr:hypothetical protein KPSA3_05520 [Pseudomonas syringae pv. actinidiae]
MIRHQRLSPDLSMPASRLGELAFACLFQAVMTRHVRGQTTRHTASPPVT